MKKAFFSQRRRQLGLFSMTCIFFLLSNLVFGNFLFLVPASASTTEPPHIEVAKEAKATDCERAEISLTINGAGVPTEERRPIDVVFVIDRSGSMAGTYMTSVKSAVSSFIDQMDFTSTEADRVAIVSYSGSSTNPSSIDYGLASDGGAAKSALNSIVASGGTCIECGLSDAYSLLGETEREQFVILLSDGVANVKYPGTNETHVCNLGTIQMSCPVLASECTDGAVAMGSSIKSDFGVELFSIGYRLSDIDTACPSSGGATSALARETLVQISSGATSHYYDGNLSNIDSVFDAIAWKINNIAGYEASIVEVLPSGISYLDMISGPLPDSIDAQTLTWNFGNLPIGESRKVQFSVSSGIEGHDGLIDVYPDTRVVYKKYDHTEISVSFPETSLKIDSCTAPTGRIAGCKWQDDGDGQREEGEALLPGWEIELRDEAGAVIASTTTSSLDDQSFGCYSFANLALGKYSVGEKAVSGWDQVFPGEEANYVHSIDVNRETLNWLEADFGNYQRPAPLFTLSGYKYIDQDGLASTTEYLDHPGEGWTIELTDTQASTTQVATSSQTGYFEFVGLSSGNYNLGEKLLGSWIQLLAPNSLISITDADADGQVFVNYLPYCGDAMVNSEEEACDDGNKENGDGCDSLCRIEVDKPVCGNGIIESGEACDSGANNGRPGYCNSDCSTTIPNGGSSSSGGGGAWFFSQKQVPAESEVPAEEPAPETEDVVVLGEEGAADLALTKKVDKSWANPGDMLEFTLVVKNSGTLDAFNVVVKDILPEGLYFKDANQKDTWLIGNLMPGASKEIKFAALISSTAGPKIYSNIATAKADNASEVRATADVEVRLVPVLAETGLDLKELILLSLIGLAGIMAGRYGRKREVKLS